MWVSITPTARLALALAPGCVSAASSIRCRQNWDAGLDHLCHFTGERVQPQILTPQAAGSAFFKKLSDDIDADGPPTPL